MNLKSIFLCVLFLNEVHLSGGSISEELPYNMICQQALTDENLFSNFRRNLIYTVVLEHLHYSEGLKYLKIIQEQYPDILLHVNDFRSNDACGNPHTYNYGDVGYFSPTTLRYMKVAGELRQLFGDKLKGMHIVEIGGGYGGQCKIIADLCGFASYTIIDLEGCVKLTEKYLNFLGVDRVNFLSNRQLGEASKYDLVISNYAFSEIEGDEQALYIEKIIKNTPYGYMTLNFLEPFGNRFSTEELLSILLQNDRKGKVEIETPLTHHLNVLLHWKPVEDIPVSRFDDLAINTDSQKNSFLLPGVTYNFSGGRLGDNLVAYFHAKWFSMEYQLPLLFKPFPFSEYFNLSLMDSTLASQQFNHHIYLDNLDKMTSIPPATLITLPYFPEGKLEIERDEWASGLRFKVDWDDPIFKKEVEKCLAPTTAFETIDLPVDYICVALHVRRGGDVDDYESAWKSFHLKFPPDSYYIAQLEKISKVFKGYKIYAHLFTDHKYPQQLIDEYARVLQNPNIAFGYGSNHDIGGDIDALFHDFYSIPKFDCLIGCESNFSYIAAMLGEYLVKIMPTNYTLIDGKHHIDQTEIKFMSKRNQ